MLRERLHRGEHAARTLAGRLKQQQPAAEDTLMIADTSQHTL